MAGNPRGVPGRAGLSTAVSWKHGFDLGETAYLNGANHGPLPRVALAAAEEAGAPLIKYGVFINTVLDFLIVAFAIFMVIKGMNSMKKKEEEKPAEPAKPSEDIVLLTEIRDALKNS